ncbi:MAG: kelch repeat-containing protein [Candidatus Limnocylindrales bacterium]
MTRPPARPDFDHRIAEWLEGDPEQAPGSVLGTVLAAFPSISQRRASRVPSRFPPLNRFSLVGAAAAMIVAVGLGGLLLGFRPNGPAIGTVPSPSHHPSTTPQTSPSASPTASPTPAASVDGYEGAFTRLGTRPAATLGGNFGTPIAIALADGRVLVAGGADQDTNDGPLAATVFDVGTSASILLPRAINGVGTGVLLPDGRVFLIAHDRSATSSTAYLADPMANTFRLIEVPGFVNAPPFGVEPSLALLRDGRVLVAGGQADVYKPDLLASALLFDPVTETFEQTGSMRTARWHHAMVTLPDGRVLVAGGEGSVSDGSTPPTWLSSAEVYEPASGRFAAIEPMQNVSGRTMAVLLPDGRVVVLPKWSAEEDDLPERTGVSPVGEVFDPTTLTFAPALGSLPSIADSATLLTGGRLLVTGATLASGPQLRSWAVVYDPDTGAATDLPAPVGRLPGTAALPDGRVVLAWGFGLVDRANTVDSQLLMVDIFE